MKRVLTATFVKYNMNNRGSFTGDCVARAISLAFNKPYHEVLKDLNVAKNSQYRHDSYKFPSVFSRVIKQYGGSVPYHEPNNPEDRITVEEFADIHNQGTYILSTNQKANAILGDHLQTIIDGKIFDTWDSSHQYVVSYYICPNRTFNRTDVSDHMEELKEYAKEIGASLFDKYIAKALPDTEVDYSFRGWTDTNLIDIIVRMEIDREDFSFTYKIPISFESTVDESKKKIADVSKVRIYDRIAELKKKVLSARERRSQGLRIRPNLYGSLARRTFNSLPGWVQGRTYSLSVEQPGQYSDSYELRLVPFEDDKDYVDIDPLSYCLRFEAYDASMLKDMLDRYKATREAPRRDYNPYEEY